MRSSRKGFTLIELVVVIAILGILVAVAIPKYVDITAQAKKAADDGYVAGLRSTTVMMYASNVVAGVTNSAGAYWPASSNTVIANMADTNYNFPRYYTSVSYNITNGVWTAQ